MARASISLTFSPATNAAIRSRISYILRVFAAVYDYRIAAENERADYRCAYGFDSKESPGGDCLRIPARYRPHDSDNALRTLQRHRFADEDFHLVFGVDPTTGQPDWFGEIFEWISSSLEMQIRRRDPVGRVPFAEMVFTQQGISERRAHASALMAWFDAALKNATQAHLTSQPPSPLPGFGHLVVCTHDIDFQYTRRATAARRLIKNLGVAVTPYRSELFFTSNIRMLLGLLRGERPGDYIRPMLNALEREGLQSTLFAVAHSSHRRDPEYALGEIANDLQQSQRRGFPVAVHGSYRSVIEDRSLASEVAVIQNTLGRRPRGGRQHWLRFDDHARFFREVEKAQLVYDSTLGFSETCGFRNGAGFAFPPYDFESEKAHCFLEIPLVIMDGSLAMSALRSSRSPQELADEILSESRRWGWGGIAILWHNPMEPVQVPDQINRVFWDCAAKRKLAAEKWMSAEQFLEVVLPRYHQAGLLTEINLDA